MEEARQERFRRLFRRRRRDASTIASSRKRRRPIATGYMRIRRPIAGAAALLAAVKQRAPRRHRLQQPARRAADKLRQCELDGYVDVLVVSEEAGMSKPDPRIFEIALDRLGMPPRRGRNGRGFLGRRRDRRASPPGSGRSGSIRDRSPSPEPDAGVVELYALEPVPDALEVIFGGLRSAGPEAPALQRGLKAPLYISEPL